MTIYYKLSSGKTPSEPFALMCLRDFAQWRGTITLARTELGKPYIAQPTEMTRICFNATHCDGLIACVVSDKAEEIGIDAERVNPKVPAERIAQRYYTPEERQYIADSSNPQRAFFEVWTAKEAYIKCTGKGLSEGLHSFSVITDDQLAPTVHGRRLMRAEIEDFLCAVCLKGNDQQVEYKEICDNV